MNDPHLARFPVLEPGRSYRSRLFHELSPSNRTQTRNCTSLRARLRSERGAATAEYAITTLAAVGFAGLLVVVLRSGEVRSMLTDIIRSALSIPS
jgi:Flp pilus assembly pilin Flp